jgi:hypothetical protein
LLICFIYQLLFNRIDVVMVVRSPRLL